MRAGRRVMPGVRGRSVAIVGRAGTLAGSGSGAAIDEADVVVRVNWTLPLNAPAEDVGARTDVLYYCAGCLGQKDAAEAAGVTAIKVDKALRRALAKQSRRSPKRYRPNTGVVAIFDALESGAARVMAFGFDFYRSGVVSPTAPWNGDKVAKWRHDQGEDRRLLRRLLHTNRSFCPDATLTAALQ